jgi:hypothetical protein
VDRLLHLLGWEREYMQLHRDTTVQSLTVTPALRDGVISYDDSPVVNAVKYGRILVVRINTNISLTSSFSYCTPELYFDIHYYHRCYVFSQFYLSYLIFFPLSSVETQMIA